MKKIRRRFLFGGIAVFVLLAVALSAACFLREKKPASPVFSFERLTARTVGQTVTVSEQGRNAFLFLPSCADKDTLTLAVDSAFAGEVAVLPNTEGDALPLPAGKETAVSLSRYAKETDGVYALTLSSNEKTYPLSVLFSSGLPSLFLSVDESRGTLAAVEADKTKQTACYGEGQLFRADGESEPFGGFSLSGRGNSTWQREKNPYKLNLDKSRDLLGMGASKKWALLAMYDDPSLVRNLLGMSVARELGFNYVPEGELIDLYIGGAYRGTYTLSERIKLDPARLALTDMEEMIDGILSTFNDAYSTEFVYLSELAAAYPDLCVLSPDYTSVAVTLPAGKITLDLTGGYLLEIDFYKDTPQFALPSGTKITVKSPENLAPSADDPLFTYLSDYLSVAEALLDLPASDASYLSVFDADSFAKAWLLKEFTMDFDACVSLYMTLSFDGKLTAGPIWDLENIFALNRDIYGNADPSFPVIAHGGRHETVDSWLTKFSLHPSFFAYVKEQFDANAAVFDGESVSSRVEALLKEVEASARMNALLFPDKTREDESTFLPAFIRARAEVFPSLVADAVKEAKLP